jgi:hypothetical protein
MDMKLKPHGARAGLGFDPDFLNILSDDSPKGTKQLP